MRPLLYTLLLCLGASGVFAQAPNFLVTFQDVTVCSPTAQQLDVEVTVSDFEDVVGAQWTFQWDPTVLSFDYTDPTEGPIDFNLTDLTRGNFGFGPAGTGDFVDNGQMTLVYSNGVSGGVDLPDGTRIMTLRFDIVDATRASTVTGNGALIAPISSFAATGFPTPGDVLFVAGTVNPSDLVDPQLACPAAPVNFTAATGATAAPVSGLASGATDNCGVATVTYSSTGATTLTSAATGINDVSVEAFNIGTTTVTYIASDANGNTADCTFDVVVAAAPVSADVEFVLPDVSLVCGATSTSVDVLVNGFTDVASFSGVVDFDPTQLSYAGVTDISPDVPGFSPLNFSTNQTATGQLIFLWTEDPQGPPPTTATLADGSRLFRVDFDILATPTNDVTVASGTRTLLEVVRRVGGTTTTPNVSVEPASFLLADTDPPNVSNCNNQTASTDPGACEATVTFALPTAFDACDGNIAPVLTSALGSGDVFPEGETTVEYTFTDQAGNSAACTLTVTVSDDEAPTLVDCPVDVTLTTANGICTAVATLTPPTATDNCTANVTVTDDAPANGAFPIGTTTVTYSATDDAGNTATCTVNVVVNDGTPPVFDFCPGTQNVAPNTGACEFSGTLPIPTATDDCGAVTVAPTTSLPSVFPAGQTLVSYTATDLSGNTAVCEFLVNVSDNEAPTVASCPQGPIALTAAAGSCQAAALFTEPTFTDNCPGLAVTSNVSPGDLLDVGTTLVVYTATDAAGQTSTCEFELVVAETEAPTFDNCLQNPLTVRVINGLCERDVNFPAPQASDNCDPNPTVTQTAGPAPGSIFPLGSTTITYQATDASGNTAECTFEVNVIDLTVPTIDCPADQTYQLVSPNVASTAVNVAPTFDDNCGAPALTYATTGATTISGSGDVENLAFNIGVTDVTYTVTDDSGNSAECTFQITVLAPVGAPTIECPQNQSVAADAACQATVSGLALTITSDIDDVASVSYELAGATTAASPLTGINDASSETFNVGITTVTYLATGTNGESATCSFEVEVRDEVAPTVDVCSTATVVLQADFSCEAVALFTAPSFAGGCAGITVTSNVEPGDILPIGDTVVTYVATGASGQEATCSFTITVEPTAPPSLNCPADVTATATADSCGTRVFFAPATATAPCGGDVVLTSSAASGDVFPIGTTEVTVTATDDAGLSATCTFEVTVSGTGGIEVEDCPADQTLTADSDCEATASWTPPTFSGDCGTITVTSTHQPGDTFGAGATTVTYTATSSLGATASCSFEIEVLDRTPPTISNCPADIALTASAATCTATANWPVIVGTDACGGAVTVTTSQPNGADFPVGQTIVFVSATDASGNAATCSFTVTVTGDATPVFDCPADIIYRTDGQLISDDDAFITSGFSNGCDGIFLDFDLPSATSACGTVAVEQIGGAPSGSIYPVGFTNLLFEATSGSGQTVSCEVVIEVREEPTVEIELLGAAPCVGDDVRLIIPRLNAASVSWFGPGGLTSTSDTLALTGVTADQAGEYTVTTVTQGGCTQTATYTLEVGAQPLPEITTPDFVCGDAGDDLVLQVVDRNGGMISSYAWSGPNGFTSTQATPIIAGATQAASGTYTVTIASANGCGTASTSKTITVGSQPNTPLVTVSDPTPCTDQEIIFTGSAYAATSVDYQWTVTPQAGVRLDPVNFVAVVRAEVPGTYAVCYTAVVGGCATQEVCTTIDVEAMPTISLSGRDSIACSDGTRELVLMEMSGSGATYTWRGPNGAVLSQSRELRIPNVSSANAGLYSLNVASANGCTADTAVNVRISDQPDAPVLQTNQATICEGNSATLSATGMGSDVTYLWTANVSADVAGIPAANNMPLITVSPTEPGTYIYELRVSRDGCISDAVTVEVAVVDGPDLEARADGPTDCVLPTDQIELLATADAGVDYRWTGPNNFVSAMASPTLVGPTEAASGTYTVTVTNGAGCTNTEELVLEVTRGVAQLETFFDGDLCRGESVQLFADEVQGAQYEWVGPSGFTADDQNPVIQSLTPSLSGEYVVVATLPNGCSSPASEPLAIDVLATPEALVDQFRVDIGAGSQPLDILANDELAGGDFTVTLTREPVFGEVTIGQDGNLTYVSASESPREDRLEYEVCYMDCPDQCARALVTINVDFDRAECITTTVITPNGDGENDNFYVSCLEDPAANPQNTLAIYNEWGDEVFSASPYLNDWEGTYEGSDLPDGTYYYLFRAGPTADEQRGFITLFR